MRIPLNRFVLMIILAIFVCVSVPFVRAETSSSTNYQISDQDIDSGSGLASSSNYRLEGTMGSFITGNRSGETFTTSPVGAGGASGGSLGSSAGSSDILVSESVDPQISSIYMAYSEGEYPISPMGMITLTPGGDTSIHVSGTVIERNGSGTMRNVSLAFYRSGVSGESSCVDNPLNCYKVVSCAVTATTEWAMTYDCEIPVSYIADSTTSSGSHPNERWVMRVTARDDTGRENTKEEYVEIDSLIALTIPGITFGQLDLGSSTVQDTNYEMKVVQQGNTMADVEVSARSNLTCSINGEVPRENIRWSLEDVGYEGTGATAIGATPVRMGLFVARPTSTLPVDKSIFWNILIPAEGNVQGICSGAVRMTVISAN